MKSIAFSVPIYKYKVENWNTKKKQLLNLFDNFDSKIIGNVITSPSDIRTNIFLDEIKLFEKEIGIDFYHNITIWFQKYEQSMNHAVHIHGATGFSSVCFIEYNEENHKSTVFVSPFGNCVTGTLERYSPEVEEGDIIFFPSNLLHYVPTNLSNEVRTVASFNLYIKNIESICEMSYN